jgi:hypothetical protein
MMYEYKVLTWDAYMGIGLERLLNECAAEGWEFVSMTGSDERKDLVFRKLKD